MSYRLIENAIYPFNCAASSKSRVPCRYLKTCFSATQWSGPGFCVNWLRVCTAKEISGLVPMAAYIEDPIATAYRVLAQLSLGALDRLVSTTFGSVRVVTGLASDIWYFSKIQCSYCLCDSVTVPGSLPKVKFIHGLRTQGFLAFGNQGDKVWVTRQRWGGQDQDSK